MGYGILRYVSGSAQLRGQAEPQLTFNYLGQMNDAIEAEGLRERASGGYGSTRSERGMRKHLLEVNGSVLGGRLQFSWSYSERVHERRTIEGLAQGFVGGCSKLIEHCRGSEGGYTPSDFPLVRMSQEELDRVIRAAGGAKQVQDIYPASSLQQGLLFHSLYAPETTVYVVTVGWS